MSDTYGAWNPGIQSQIPLELRQLCTFLRPENVSTSVAEASELQPLTGLPLSEVVTFRPERLLLHELMIRVMADFSVPDGSRIGDLGINFREMTRRLLERHLQPEMHSIIRAYEEARIRMSDEIRGALAAVTAAPPAPAQANARGSQPRREAGLL